MSSFARVAGLSLAPLLGLAALLSMTAAAVAQNYPNRPIKWIVSFPPGGSTDVVARAMLPSLEKRLGQPVVIENRGGAGGNLGTDAVAKADPDGYTIGFSAAGALTVNPSLMEKMPYNVQKDLIPITLVGTSPFLLVASPKFESQTLSEVIAAAKAKPGELTIGHGGNGTAMHLTAALFNQMGGVSTTLVPYRGSGPVTADVVAGHIPLGITDAPSAIGQIKGGAVKALAVSSLKRTPSLPDVPTFDELGLKGYEFDRLVRGPCSGRYAAGYRRQAQRGFRRDTAGAGCGRTHSQRGRRTEPDEARGVRRLHQGRDRRNGRTSSRSPISRRRIEATLAIAATVHSRLRENERSWVHLHHLQSRPR